MTYYNGCIIWFLHYQRFLMVHRSIPFRFCACYCILLTFFLPLPLDFFYSFHYVHFLLFLYIYFCLWVSVFLFLFMCLYFREVILVPLTYDVMLYPVYFSVVYFDSELASCSCFFLSSLCHPCRYFPAFWISYIGFWSRNSPPCLC